MTTRRRRFAEMLAEAKEEVDAECKTIETKSDHKVVSGASACREKTDNLIEQILDYWETFYLSNDPQLQQLFAFEIQHWDKFDPDATEFTFEHTALHQQYRQMFESKLVDFLDERGLSSDEFYSLLANALESYRERDDSDSGHKLYELIRKVDDFHLWALSMRQAARDKRNLYDVD